MVEESVRAFSPADRAEHGGLRVALALATMCVTPTAFAQNTNDCIDASERGQKLIDDRRLLSARNAFLSCAADSCPAPVRRDCQSHLEELKKSIPSVVVRVKDKDGSDIARGAVSLDGAKVGVLDGQTVALDPGTHAIHVELPNGRVFDRQVILAAGDGATSVTFDTVATATQTTMASEAPKTHWSTVKTVGFIGIWVGAASIVTGLLTQVIALTQQSNATTLQARSSFCPTLDANAFTAQDTDCANAQSYHSQALGMQTTTFVLWGAGAAVLAAGIIMFVAGGNVANKTASVHVTPLVGPSLAGIGLSGSF